MQQFHKHFLFAQAMELMRYKKHEEFVWNLYVLLNFQLKHNNMKDKRYMNKVVCLFLLFTALVLQQSGLSYSGTQQVGVFSKTAITLLTFPLPLSWG